MSETICLCAHPKSWHGDAGKNGVCCVGKFCKCKKLKPSFIQYDPEKWAQGNELERIKKATR